MASFHGTAAKIRGIVESDEFDLASIKEPFAAASLIKDAFGTPFAAPLAEMVRATLVVGAGKANRQKYDASLMKWVVAALKDIDYADDKSATCDFASAGSFKTQHDTGRNLFFVHVFPRCARKTDDAAETATVSADEPASLSREHLLVAAELPTFNRTVQKKCASWTSKKRLLEALRKVRTDFARMDAKLMNRETLEDDEQALYDLGSTDDLDAKLKALQTACKDMIDAGRLTSAEKTTALAQMDERLEALPAAAAKPRARVEENRAALLARDVSGWRPPKPEHDAAIRALQTRLAPLFSLEKSSSKGSLLSANDVMRLGEKPDLEERIAKLEEASRGWYETDDELAERLKPLKENLKKLKQKHAAPAPKASGGGWAVASGGRSKKPSSRGGGKSGGGSYGGFSALG